MGKWLPYNNGVINVILYNILYNFLFLALMLLHEYCDFIPLFYYIVFNFNLIDDSLMLVIYLQCTDDKVLRCYQDLGWKRTALMLLCYIIIYFIHILSSEMVHEMVLFILKA